MRLNTTQVERTLSQMNAQVLPDDHPAVAQLTNLFGDHTFFLDENGLKVLEPAGVPKEGVQSAEVAGEVAGGGRKSRGLDRRDAHQFEATCTRTDRRGYRIS